MLKPTSRNRSHSTTPGAFLGFLAFALLTLVAATPISSLKFQGDANANGNSLTNACNIAATNVICAPTVVSTNFVGNGASLTNIPPAAISGAGASTGNVLTWNGSQYAPAAASGGVTTLTDGTGLLTLSSSTGAVTIDLTNPVNGANGLAKYDSGGDLLVNQSSDDGSGANLQVKGGGHNIPALKINVSGTSAEGLQLLNANNLQTTMVWKSASSYDWLMGADVGNSGANNWFIYDLLTGNGAIFIDCSSGTPKIQIGNAFADDGSESLFEVAGVTSTQGLIVNSPTIPGSSSATGFPGQIAWDSNYIYVCVATNTWERCALSTW